MSGLLGLLDLGSSAFQAQNAGVAVAGRNLANLNTIGYSRENVTLSSQLGAPLIGGVSAGDPTRQDSPLLSSRERLAAGSSGMADAQAAALAQLEQDLTGSGADVASAVGNFFAAADRLSSSPAEEGLRQALIEKANALARTLKDSAEAVASSQAEANKRITEYAARATELARQVADANKSYAATRDPIIADQRDQAAKQLAELTGGQARTDADGMMRVVLGGGAVLVDGERAAQVKAVADPADATKVGVQLVDGTHTVDVSGQLDGGKLAGELAFRDGTAQSAANELDGLAYDLATQVNAVHQASYGLDGNKGRDLFVQPTATKGAAAAFAVDPGVLADHRVLATAGAGEGTTGTSGILALTALRDQPLAGGGQRSFSDQAIHTVTTVGQDAASAHAARISESARVQSLASARDSLSGVSQEDELTKLAAFQRAAQGATRFTATVNELLGDLIQKL